MTVVCCACWWWTCPLEEMPPALLLSVNTCFTRGFPAPSVAGRTHPIHNQSILLKSIFQRPSFFIRARPLSVVSQNLIFVYPDHSKVGMQGSRIPVLDPLTQHGLILKIFFFFQKGFCFKSRRHLKCFAFPISNYNQKQHIKTLYNF